MSVEVKPVDLRVVEELKAAGHAVYRGNRNWRVAVVAPVLGRESVRAQAHVVVTGLLSDFDIRAASEPPVWALRDPDAVFESAEASWVLDDARRAYEPDPLERRPRAWWKRAMELGLGERKGD